MFILTTCALRVFGLFGILAAILFTTADLLYNHVPGSKSSPAVKMSRMTESRLLAGGSLGLSRLLVLYPGHAACLSGFQASRGGLCVRAPSGICSGDDILRRSTCGLFFHSHRSARCRPCREGRGRGCQARECFLSEIDCHHLYPGSHLQPADDLRRTDRAISVSKVDDHFPADSALSIKNPRTSSSQGVSA